MKDKQETMKKRGYIGLIVGGGIFFTVFTLGLLVVIHDMRYQETIFHNVHIGSIEVEELTPKQAEQRLYEAYEKMIEAGLTIEANGKTAQIPLSTVTESDFAQEFIVIDAALAAQKAFAYGHQGNWTLQLQERLRSLFGKQEINITEFIDINEEGISEKIREAFSEMEKPGRPTDYIISENGVQVALGNKGMEINIDQALTAITNDATDLELETLTITQKQSEDPVSIQEAESLIPELQELQEKGGVTLVHKTELGRELQWEIQNELLIEALYPAKTEEGIGFKIDPESLNNLFTQIEEEVNREPQNARFQIENNRVIEFATSRNGATFEKEETVRRVETYLNNPSTEPIFMIAVETVEPQTKTGEVNDLGITEVLGTGTSSWRGSSQDRLKNIRNATEKLNGLLIAPGEQVSTTGNVGPLTLAGGYVPEMVIAGDEIKPEIAGGLCQIGTTLFRAAMNTGLSIDERRNHSLVVSYYNDPQNGNPGTDATLYEPILDLKFTNTTDQHVLLTTELDYERQELVYTFWGTSDGRNAYYTPPQVLAWRSPGETVYKETDSLAPGQVRCQSAFPGATTSFDYIIEYPDGTREVENFTSHYRALPKICLVGIDPEAEQSEEPNASELTPEEQEALRILQEEQQSIAQ